MQRPRKAALGILAACGLLTAAYAAPQPGGAGSGPLGNLYRFYTKALHVDESGVVAVPSRYEWSVESSSAGYDTKGDRIPDGRILLRLYDPDHNFMALTAQMDLATAAKLHHDLGDLLVKTLQDPSYQHHPQLYDPKDIPTGRFKGIDKDGKAIIELEYPAAPTPPDPASK